MRRTTLKSKIHRATVTHAELNYVGSLTLDRDLMDAADLLVGEQVCVLDATNGARLETYVIEGERGSGVVSVNGAAARLIAPGDIVTMLVHSSMDEDEIEKNEPRVVLVDGDNRVVHPGSDPSARRHRAAAHRFPAHHPVSALHAST